MEKEFIKYEEALALKELSFDEPCLAKIYSDTKKIELWTTNHVEKGFSHNSNYAVLCLPLYQQAFRWFREKYGINSTTDWEFYDGFNFYFKWTIPNGNYGRSEYFKTPEEAELACLRKLIEIVKENKDE